MGAIKQDLTYHPQECIVCLNCTNVCPEDKTYFKFKNPLIREKASRPSTSQKQGISRRNFLLILSSAIPFFGFNYGESQQQGSVFSEKVIRPPGAQDENKLSTLCIRCGNCMKVCITNGLQPVTFQSGISGFWTPRLIPEIGYCEYSCNLCGQVCPTDAIPLLVLEEKKKTKLGIARVERANCIAWTQKQDCLVCEEHCPIPTKAIKTAVEKIGDHTLLKPIVDKELCIGCGMCQNKCPVRPQRAILVERTV